nr:MAG TPA: hypothetical protein [Caudoviricetes sp.]
MLKIKKLFILSSGNIEFVLQKKQEVLETSCRKIIFANVKTF